MDGDEWLERRRKAVRGKSTNLAPRPEPSIDAALALAREFVPSWSDATDLTCEPLRGVSLNTDIIVVRRGASGGGGPADVIVRDCTARIARCVVGCGRTNTT